MSSTIRFLLTTEDFSAWHRLRSEETWRYRDGDAVELIQLLAPTHPAVRTVLGARNVPGAVSEGVVAGNVWQAARLAPAVGQRGWALVECTVKPAWEEKEFELGEREKLLREFPRAAEWIRGLTR